MIPAAAGSEPLWSPSPERVEKANITRYVAWLERERGTPTPDYAALQRWSVEDLEGFWASIWNFFGVDAEQAYEGVLGSREMPGAEWFPGARLYAAHVFRGKDDSATAIHHASELRELSTMSWGELHTMTARIAGGLRSIGVEAGDRVVAYMPNVPRQSRRFSPAPRSAPPGRAARPTSARARWWIASRRSSQRCCWRSTATATAGATSTGWRPLLHSSGRCRASRRPSMPYLARQPNVSALSKPMSWEELSDRGDESELAFEALAFDHPLWVLYSSGTTGLPKAIVHGQGAILLEHLKKLNLHLDAQAGDRVFWFTTTGWMMWNFLVGVLLTRAEIVLYDGNPGHPDMGVLWDLAERAGITCFGTSAAYIASCMKEGVEPSAGRDLSRSERGIDRLPLSPEGFAWIYDHVGEDTWLFSTSGGTDVCTAFVGGVPTLPVHRGELQARALGAAVEAFDEDGNAVIGEVGELVITEPMPSMPIFFWNDPAGSACARATSDLPGVWRHGDWVEITERGTAIIYGRSDSTINRGGSDGHERDLPGRSRDR